MEWLVIGAVIGIFLAVKEIKEKGMIKPIVIKKETVVVEETVAIKPKRGFFEKLFIILGTVLLFPWSLAIWFIYFIMRKRV